MTLHHRKDSSSSRALSTEIYFFSSLDRILAGRRCSHNAFLPEMTDNILQLLLSNESSEPRIVAFGYDHTFDPEQYLSGGRSCSQCVTASV